VLFADLHNLQQEIKAVCLQLVVTYGLDGAALLVFLVCLRCHYGLGRAEDQAESEWLAQLSTTAIAHANAYLTSAFVGDVSLSDLHASLRI
jgi:hypothetical protein